ncbi:TetR family transcriptional regulator [Kyrpidia spormannii]|uniref:TetR family transcriptional regulator n=1 Tax=Kyrpidia spormannii TaxID=2055160 RepID=A0A2K8N3G5_9BACL|nr:TetR/AcrR family transcriptional regulator [Kyrpidia spormannii]ATY84014.1 TetR family transcriptional regulator [Kyrpidia spormannii]
MAKKPRLDKVMITQAAGELADQIGLEKLTLSAVADHLKVRAPSLYNHIEGLDGLLRELSLLGMKELNRRLERAALGKSRADALASMLLAYRAFAKERPGVYTATLRAPKQGDSEVQSASQAIIETVLTVLRPCALSDQEAIHVIRGFRAIGHGFASLELEGGFGMDLSTDESYQRLIAMFLRSVCP